MASADLFKFPGNRGAVQMPNGDRRDMWAILGKLFAVSEDWLKPAFA